MHSVFRDVRYALRQLSREPGASVVAVATFALGIGVTTALFSIVDATLLRPLPYPHPEQLIEISTEVAGSDGHTRRPTSSMADMRAWQGADDVVSSVAAWGTSYLGRIVEGPQPERIRVLQFTEDYLSMHGVTPVIGRGVSRADCDPGAPLVALLGFGYWQTHFGGRHDVLGQPLHLDSSQTATIIGVLPAWFAPATQVSLPLRVPAAEYARRGTGRVLVYARLRPDVTIERARARLSGVTPQLPDQTVKGVARARVASRLDAVTGSYQTTVVILASAVGSILLIACVNIAGLLLARGAARQTEFAIRTSIGASRGRLVRQVLTETLILAAIGGAAGVLLAWVSLNAIVASLPLSMPADSPVRINAAVLGGAAILLVGTSVLTGMIPALRLSQVRFADGLKTIARGSALSRRGGQVLMGGEVALALVLAAGAGLMIRSFIRISEVNLGFDPDGVITMDLQPLEGNAAARREYYAALIRQLRATPGITAAGLVDSFVLGDSTTFSIVNASGSRVFTTVFEIMPGYFETIRATLRQGRFPSDADFTSGAGYAVINESSARSMFPDGRAIGRTFTKLGPHGGDVAVIGVVADMRHNGPLNEQSVGQPAVFYLLDRDDVTPDGPMTVVVRSNGVRAGLPDELRRIATSIGPRVLVERIRTADELFDDRVLTPHRRLVLLSLLGALGVALALVGVFATTAYAVSRRQIEIGVRLALGASPARVVGTMLRDSAVPIAIGAAAGVGAAILATPAIRSFLFHTTPTDPATLAAAAGVLAITGCTAALIPSLRAARVDPATSLRAE